MTDYDIELINSKIDPMSEKDLDDLADVPEVNGVFGDCPDCMGDCELAGGLEACDCHFCGTKRD